MSRLLVFYTKLVFIILTAFLSLIGCRKMVSQNPADSFTSGRFPKALESIRAQMREIPLADKEKILARIEADKQNKNIIKVAVIDGGVDVAHEDLRAQLDYRVVDGRIVGAGFDVMGEAASGTHVLVDPTLFSFGAKAIVKGRIDQPVENPLQLLKQTEDRAIDLVLNAIQADPELRTSIFSKFTRKSLSLISLDEFNQDYKANLHSFESNKKEGVIFTQDMLDKGTDNRRLENLDKIIKSEATWNLGLGDTSSEIFEYAEMIEHGDKFIEAVHSAFEQLEKETHFNSNVAKMVELCGCKIATLKEKMPLRLFAKHLASFTGDPTRLIQSC